jgi:hypothetical protein
VTGVWAERARSRVTRCPSPACDTPQVLIPVPVLSLADLAYDGELERCTPGIARSSALRRMYCNVSKCGPKHYHALLTVVQRDVWTPKLLQSSLGTHAVCCPTERDHLDGSTGGLMEHGGNLLPSWLRRAQQTRSNEWSEVIA